MSAQRPSSPTRLTPNGPSKKHGKKKSRNSWKAGFKSTPSSPSQSTLDTHSSVLTEITAKTININSESSNINISNSNNNNSSRIIGNISDRDKGITSNSGINTVNINDGVKSIASINSISTGNINDSVKGATSISDISASNINGNAKGVTSSGLIPNNSNDNDDSSHHIVTTNANNINIGAGASSNKGSDNANISGNSRSSDQSSGGSYSTNTHGSTDTNRLPMALLDDLRLKDLIGSISPSHSTTVSLWDYLKEELTAADFETTQELKRERVANFLSVPIAFEKSSQKCDLIKVTLVVVACTILQSVDASRTYHFIRGQNAMKLYAIFNCLEIFDRLCCSFGQDILDSLFSKSTLGSHPPKASHSASRHARPITFVILAILYILAHTMVLFFQMVTLNVAVNSYSNALLTLLISNQFVEIKGSVFKKFEKENLFQLSCSDIVERFQLSVFVAIITIRNLVELSASPPSPFSVYPQSFVPLFSSMTAVARLLTPCFLVLGCETLVDWLKHAFITKFNQIRPSVYGRFVDILSRDLVVGSPAQLGGRNNHQRMFVDQSPMVSRRIGLAALPLACLVICVTIQTLQMVFSNHPSDLGQAPVVVAETIVASAVSFETISFEWTMPVVDFSSGLTVALSGVMVVVDSYFKFAWAVLNQSVAVFVHVVLAWIHRAGISQELGRRVVEYAVVALACLATYACLVALKLLIGINLLGFAYHRYLTMESREEVERQTDRMMRESNAAVEEKAVSAAVSSLLDGRGAGHANGDAYVLGGEKRVTHGLDTIDRYTLFKSRIP
ncbi:hypothetical protein BGZ58_003456 [Dissophora ornata]|nr:hypothetical protein BGZ58_003456 [Dissophora ornata]